MWVNPAPRILAQVQIQIESKRLKSERAATEGKGTYDRGKGTGDQAGGSYDRAGGSYNGGKGSYNGGDPSHEFTRIVAR